jgi:hypothetical protein
MHATMRARALPAILLLVAAAACGVRTERIDRYVEDLVTIQHGLYGQVTEVDDVGNEEETAPRYLPGFAVDAFEVPLGAELGSPVASTSSRLPRAFYELSLPAGDHVVCSSFKRCVVITLGAGELMRLDYEFSFGPGWSSGTPWPSTQ